MSIIVTDDSFYLDFLTDGCRATVEALEGYHRLKDTRSPDPYETAVVIRSAYVGIEKLLKHVVAEKDPYLLLVRPEAELLRDLRRDLIANSAPTIFASRVPHTTLYAKDVFDVVRSVWNPTIDTKILNEFGAALKALTGLRNRVQHGELKDDSDSVLAVLRRQYAQFKSVIGVICPECIDELRKISADVESWLTAIERQTNAAWQVLLDHLSEGNSVDLVANVYVLLHEPDATPSILINAPLLSTARMVGADVSGFFTKILASEDSRFVEIGEGLRFGSLAAAPPPLDEGLLPTEDGGLAIESATAWAEVHLPGRSQSHLAVTVALLDWKVSFEKGKPKGKVTGLLASWTEVPGETQRGGLIRVSGTAWLTSEAAPSPELRAASLLRPASTGVEATPIPDMTRVIRCELELVID